MQSDNTQAVEILDRWLAHHEDTVSIKIPQVLADSLERVGESWQCETISETVERMITRVENGNNSHHAFSENETKKVIRLYFDSGRRLPAICVLLNKNGQVAQDGGLWTTQKLSAFCRYHGIEYRESVRGDQQSR